jgi:hypothetical protein
MSEKKHFPEAEVNEPLTDYASDLLAPAGSLQQGESLLDIAETTKALAQLRLLMNHEGTKH